MCQARHKKTSIVGKNRGKGTGRDRTSNLRNHSFRSSAFFLLNAISINGRSSSFIVAKGIRWVPISPKYSFASSFVLVPNPLSFLQNEAMLEREVKDTRNPYLVVFRFPLAILVVSLIPLEIFRYREEILLLIVFSDLEIGAGKH
jgi:hypothetical protein